MIIPLVKCNKESQDGNKKSEKIWQSEFPNSLFPVRKLYPIKHRH